MMAGNSRTHCIRFNLAIPADQFLAYYRGQVQDIQVRANNGQTLRFPAKAVRRFLSHDGIYGSFEIRFDDANKLLGIERVSAV